MFKRDRDALNAVVRINPMLLTPYIDYPKEFVEDLIFRYYPIKPVPKLNRHQIEFFRAVVQGDWVSVRSGRGRGKTTGVALLIPWYLATRPMARVVATAPKIDLLHDVLWSQINKWLQFSPLKDMLLWSKEKVEHAHSPTTWYAVARTAKSKENLSGYHESYQMIVADEASGIIDEILQTVEETQLQNVNKKEIKTILISNPTKVTGYFYKTQKLAEWQKFWTSLHFKPTEEEVTEDAGAQRLITLYGLDHDLVLVSVFGEFPSGNPMAVISYTKAWDAMGREVIPEGAIEIGVDVARGGDDRTVFFYRYGNKVFPPLVYKKQDTVETEQKILILVRDLREKLKYNKVIRIKIDDSTMGCVTKKCKLLTPNGWKGPDELIVGDKIYSKDSFGIMREEFVLEIEPRDRVRIIEADGCEFAWAHWLPYRTRNNHRFKMGDWETALGKNRIVLDNEFVWCGKFDNFVIPEAAGMMPYGGKKVYKNERVISPEKFSDFLGWFLSEGCVTGDRITIAQRFTNPNCDLIRRSILGVNENVCVSTSRAGHSNYTFTDKWLSAWLKSNCYNGFPYHSFNKKVPQYIKGSAVSIIRIFLNSFRMGDGHIHKGAANYSTSSKFLADDLLELIVKSGRTGIKRISHTKGSKGTIGGRAITRLHDNYRVSEWKTMTRIGIRGSTALKVEREGTVYSIKISGETQLFINKFDRGKIFWSHNGGVVDHLSRNVTDGIEVIPCLFGAVGNEFYSNAASLMWAELAKTIDKLELPRSDELLEEICGRNWEASLDNRGRQRVESKDDFKRRIKRSPDLADALVLCVSNAQDKDKILPKLVSLRDNVFKNDDVRFDHKLSKRAELFGSVWCEKNVKHSCLTALWDKDAGRLTVFFEGTSRMEGPDDIVTGLGNVCDMYNQKYHTNIKPRNFIFYGNRAMFGLNDSSVELTNIKDGPYLQWLNKHMIGIIPNFRFDLNGAILMLNKMIDENRITILSDMPMLRLQLETWVIENERPEYENHPLCLALCNIISMLVQTKRLEKKPKQLIPYGVTITKSGVFVQNGGKEAFLNKVEKIFADGFKSKIRHILPRPIDAPRILPVNVAKNDGGVEAKP